MKMLSRFSIAVCALFVILVLLPTFTKADGGIMPRPDYYANETAQKAFIYYQNQTENLVVSVSYQGNSADFAWIIPLPSKPEISKSSIKLFTTLQEITKINDSGPIIYGSAFSLRGASESSSVEVVEEKTVDIYDTAILKATDDKVLSKWLNDHGYTFPEDKSTTLQSYIDNGWYFTVAKIQTATAENADIKNKLATGTITPLRLTFQTDKIIYPMKLTGVALNIASENSSKLGVAAPSSNIPIVLYVLSDSRTSQDSLTTSWANWIDANEINDLNNGEGWIKSSDKLFLTRMADTVSIKDMSDDFVIERAENNDVYPVPVYKTADFWLTNVLLILAVIWLFFFFPPFGLIFTVFVFLQTLLKNKAVHIIGSIYQILVCFIAPVVGVLVYFSNHEDLSGLFLQAGFIGTLIAVVILEIVVIFSTIKMLKRYKSITKQEF